MTTRYNNFKIVVFCTAQNMIRLTEEQVRKQLDWFRYYCGCDKVYLEPYRDSLTIPDDQLKMLIRVFNECGVEVSGALTTTCDNLTPADADKYRFSGTYCYVNKDMRAHLESKVRYAASYFDEIILDDWFFTYCTCDECRAAKGDMSWQEFRTQLMLEVSENLVIKPAKEVNPNCKLIIKYPNWSESYSESGYDPDTQRRIYDMIYTGTETRDTANTDQHLPRYMSYSLTRLMENYAPGRNGGCWFDPYGCSPIDYYLEQGYMSAFARPKELTLFCWGSLYKNRVVTPLGLQLDSIDKFLDTAGACIGTPCYLPPRSQGEDHLEDFMGMLGIPLELTPDFPTDAKSVFLTVKAHTDPDIIDKLTKFVANGGKAIVTSGFMIDALGRGIEELTSIRYKGRRFSSNRFRDGAFFGAESYSRHVMTFPLLEHRNNTTWATAKAVAGEENYPIAFRDHYGKGQLITISVPDEYGYMYDLPPAVLAVIRQYFTDAVPYYLNGPGQVSLFSYDNDTFAIYKYTDKLTSGGAGITTIGNADSLVNIENPEMVITPTTRRLNETVFNIPFVQPGDLNYFRINWSKTRFDEAGEFKAVSAPDDFNVDD